MSKYLAYVHCNYILTSRLPNLEYDLCTVFETSVSHPVGHDSLRLCAFIDNLLVCVPSIEGKFGIRKLVGGYVHGGLEIITGSTTVRVVLLAAFYGVHEYVLRDEPRIRSIMKGNFKPQLLAPLIAETATSSKHITVQGLMRILEFHEISPNLPAFSVDISSWHHAIFTVLMRGQFDYLHLVLPLFATCLLRGADPRFYLRVGPQLKDSKWLFVNLFCSKERRPIEITGFDLFILLTPALKDLFAQQGPEISLRCLFGIWFPRHAKLLQEMIGWIEERGPDLSSEQLQELHDTFELATRPLRLADPQQIDLNIHRVKPAIMNIIFSRKLNMGEGVQGRSS
ncbi:hypothetical protein BJX68DRAFT_227234 [Aspergillus pseudodeflectus]|uniref:Uncharacterized protein n=1 Tax=Aspergillus pseudodeflectus TaxID=176178 RepID=A0ABR4L2N3_9EURO